jgi:hypothetical protein
VDCRFIFVVELSDPSREALWIWQFANALPVFMPVLGNRSQTFKGDTITFAVVCAVQLCEPMVTVRTNSHHAQELSALFYFHSTLIGKQKGRTPSDPRFKVTAVLSDSPPWHRTCAFKTLSALIQFTMSAFL